MKYQVQYKCRHCNCSVPASQNSIVDLSETDAKNFLSQVLMNQQFIGNPYLYEAPMTVLHNCKDGSIAFADIAGLVRI